MNECKNIKCCEFNNARACKARVCVLLYKKNRDLPLKLLDNDEFDLTTNEILTIFRHSTRDKVNIPNGVLQLINNDETIKLKNYSNVLDFEPVEMKGMVNTPVFLE